MTGNTEVQVEIKTFLQALASYPDRFAANPSMSFEEYHSSLAAVGASAATRTAPQEK